jgi:carboxymethylenebutenolidase
MAPNYAITVEQVSFNDESIKAGIHHLSSPNGHGEVRGYLVRLAGVTEPAVVVAHENRGLNSRRGCAARRLAKAGFMALAPTADQRGGYPGNDAGGRDLWQPASIRKADERLLCRGRFMMARDRPGTSDHWFCHGGVANAAAVLIWELKRRAHYWRQPDAADVPQIERPLDPLRRAGR